MNSPSAFDLTSTLGISQFYTDAFHFAWCLPWRFALLPKRWIFVCSEHEFSWSLSGSRVGQRGSFMGLGWKWVVVVKWRLPGNSKNEMSGGGKSWQHVRIVVRVSALQFWGWGLKALVFLCGVCMFFLCMYRIERNGLQDFAWFNLSATDRGWRWYIRAL